MNRFRLETAVCLGCMLTACLTANVLLGQRADNNKRARLPDWKELPPGIFFEDAFRDGLTGPRPKVRGATNNGSSGPEQTDADQPPVSSGFAWSQLISASTIEDEIKAIRPRVEDSVKTAGHFKGRGYLEARREFSIAAVLFAIVADYDDDVRWKKSAAVARDSMARVAANAKVGTTPVYREAKQRILDLDDLIRGSSLAGKPTQGDVEWGELFDRGPLMLRLEQSHQERLAMWLASKNEFNKQHDRIVHEAELVAMLAQVLATEGMQDADDDDYKAYCETLKKAAQDLIDSTKRNDYDAARRSAGEIHKSCGECHELYRA